MEKVVYEIRDPEALLDTEEGLWRVVVRKTWDHRWNKEKQDYDCFEGDVASFKFRKYVDAERAGFSGYMGQTVTLPVSVILEAADAIRAGEVPREDPKYGGCDE